MFLPKVLRRKFIHGPTRGKGKTQSTYLSLLVGDLVRKLRSNLAKVKANGFYVYIQTISFYVLYVYLSKPD